MLNRAAIFVPTLVILAAFASSAAKAADTYTTTITYPKNTDTIQAPSTVTVTGTITWTMEGSPAPSSVKVKITDRNGYSYYGSGGTVLTGMTSVSFAVAVVLPANAATGAATVTAVPESGYGAGAITRPTIANP